MPTDLTGSRAKIADRTGVPARTSLRGDGGSILIETALSFMVMMTMVLGIIEFCVMCYTYAVVEDAAREGVRYASIHGTDSTACSGPSTGCSDITGANVVSHVTSYAGEFTASSSKMQVTVSYPDSASTPTSRVQVAIHLAYPPLFHVPGSAQTLQVSSEGRIVF